MMGVYGMLAVGLALFCLRYLIPDDRWPERPPRSSFWSLNIGLAWMTFATLFPLGPDPALRVGQTSATTRRARSSS